MTATVITGATGFVGRRLIDQLAGLTQVVAITRDGAAQLPGGVDQVAQDLSNPIDTSKLPSQVDRVIHLAQSPRHRDFPDGAADMLAVNVDATLALAEYARRNKARSFVYASSGGICGFRQHPIHEDDPPAPLSFYLRTKYASEHLLQAYTGALNVVALRYFFPFGEGQSGMLVANLIDRIATGQPVSLQGVNGIRLNPTYVSDVADATRRSLSLEGFHVLNVAGPDTVSFRELATIIGELVGKPPVFETSPEAAGNLVGDRRRLQETLNWAPETSLRDGLERAVSARRT
jgi:UDP-glucose 4-epimerase